MKLKSTLAALVLMALPTVSIAATTESCVVAAEGIVRPMAEARDEGLPSEHALIISMRAGLDPEAAVAVVKYVYTSPDMTPQELAALFLETCIE